MITYVDTSSLLKLLVEEQGSERALEVWSGSDRLLSAAVVVVEARAALAAAHRGRRLTVAQHRRAKTELAALVGDLALVPISAALLDAAAELAEADRLRGYDAVHLAAALHVGTEVLTSADADLCAAAGRHGLHVANPLAASP